MVPQASVRHGNDVTGILLEGMIEMVKALLTIESLAVSSIPRKPGGAARPSQCYGNGRKYEYLRFGPGKVPRQLSVILKAKV